MQIDDLKRQYCSLFEWADGPLVTSMKCGDLLLLDEISLAEDSVLERLNSVFEPGRKVLLAEKGGTPPEIVQGTDSWRVMATMNPGGDFGKRELSPALRNRFSEVWVPELRFDDARLIVEQRLAKSCLGSTSGAVCDTIMTFCAWFERHTATTSGLSQISALGVRDMLAWCDFISAMVEGGIEDERTRSTSEAQAYGAVVHGAEMVIFDGLGLSLTLPMSMVACLRSDARAKLHSLLPQNAQQAATAAAGAVAGELGRTKRCSDGKWLFGATPFWIPMGPLTDVDGSVNGQGETFSFGAPTTSRNVCRLLRAMQLKKPILMEGSPGVGKTSLVSALAGAAGHKLVRINLSEQTDLADLLGADLPLPDNDHDVVEDNGVDSSQGVSAANDAAPRFAWCDGVLLRAIKNGDWVLLDELNLASQSVLEGLNAILDHRAEVYIPELGQTFTCATSFRIFGAQNPLAQGGGRKGLPKSFLNRFTKVYVEPMNGDDLQIISNALFPSFAAGDNAEKLLLSRAVAFNQAVHTQIMESHSFGRLGAPWEFNLRDIVRWCSLALSIVDQLRMDQDSHKALEFALQRAADIIYVLRMRCETDRCKVSACFEETFGVPPCVEHYPSLDIGDHHIIIGSAILHRRASVAQSRVRAPPLIFSLLRPLEAVAHAVNNAWPCLLVGASGCGKSTLLRGLAALVGQTLHEMALCGSTDSTDLLGCFEQASSARSLYRALDAVEDLATQCAQKLLQSTAMDTTHVQQSNAESSAMRVMECLHEMIKEKRAVLDVSATAKVEGESAGGSKTASSGNVISVARKLLQVLEQCCTAEIAIATLFSARVRALRLELESGVRAECQSATGRFVWTDGPLLRAVEGGEWLVLDNANLCSASVLDRLNSLLEPAGELLVSESGSQNVVTQSPHLLI
eukprot:g649.t1